MASRISLRNGLVGCLALVTWGAHGSQVRAVQGGSLPTAAHLRGKALTQAIGTVGKLSQTSAGTRVVFKPKPDGSEGSYRISIKVPTTLATQTASLIVRFKLKIDGWKSIQYVGYGWRYPDREFAYIANFHPEQGVWFPEHLDPNGYEQYVVGYKPKNGAMATFEIYVKGVVGSNGASVSVASLSLERPTPPMMAAGKTEYVVGKDCIRHCLDERGAQNILKQAPAELTRALKTYAHGFFDGKYSGNGADLYLETGNILLRGVTVIPGDWRGHAPPIKQYTTTHRYLWNALWLPRAFLDRYQTTSEEKYLNVAMHLTDRWFKNNVQQKSNDPKYAWYDHGVGQRLITLTLEYINAVDAGQTDPADLRQMARRIYRHQELLASDWFYAHNQLTRWHNHALFQDMALIISASLVPFQKSGYWSRRAGERAVSQFEHLVSKEGISVENSSGYHVLEAGLCSRTVSWLDLIRSKASLHEAHRLNSICKKMYAFATAIAYPDYRYPAFGDARPSLNADVKDWTRPYNFKRYLNFYPKSGYFVARGGEQAPWQLTVTGSSLSATHKHQDNLELILWADGIAWIMDPGYYTYQPGDPIALFARGPGAHNALRLKGVTESIKPGMARLHLQRNGSRFVISGVSTATPRAVVTRKVSGDMHGTKFVIHDKLADTAVESVERALTLQFGDGVRAVKHGDVIDLTYPGSKTSVQIHLNMLTKHCSLIAATSDHLPAGPGWVYPSFGKAVAADALVCGHLPRAVDWSITLQE